MSDERGKSFRCPECEGPVAAHRLSCPSCGHIFMRRRGEVPPPMEVDADPRPDEEE